MPKKQKKMIKNFTGAGAKSSSPQFPDGEVFRNFFAVPDDVDPRVSLRSLKEMFSGKVEEDVVTMVFSECAYDVGHTVETLIALSNDKHGSNVDSPVLVTDASSVSLPSESSHKLELKDNPVNSLPCDREKEEIPVLHPQSCIEMATNSSSKEFMTSYSSVIMSEYSESNRSLKCLDDCKNQISHIEENSFFSSQNVPFSDGIAHKLKGNFPAKQSQPYSQGESIVSSSVNSNSLGKQSPFYNRLSNERHSLPFSHIPMHNHQVSPHFVTPFLPFHTKKPVVQKKTSHFHSLSSQKNILVQSRRKESRYFSNVNDVSSKIVDKKPILLILRGLPGSGKSTLAKELKFSGVILSTDDYFERNGKYQFDFRKLSEAHEWNRKRTADALKRGVSPIIIDNTNTEAWEMLPYVKLGLMFQYEIHILEPNTPWKFKPSKLAKKNSHRVSKEKIEKMLERYDHSITVESLIVTLNNFINKKTTSPSGSQNKIEKCGGIKTCAQEAQSNSVNDVDSFSSESYTEDVCDSQDSKFISLEAVVHREDEDHADHFEDMNKITEKNSASSKENKSENVNSRQNTSEHLDDKKLAFQGWNKIDDINELKMLLQVESEESHGINNTQTSSDSSQDVSGWEAITEHDDDFFWRSSSVGGQNVKMVDTKGNLNSVDSTEDFKCFKTNLNPPLLMECPQNPSKPDEWGDKEGEKSEDISFVADNWVSKDSHPLSFEELPGAHENEAFSCPKPQRDLLSKKSLIHSTAGLTPSYTCKDRNVSNVDVHRVSDCDWFPLCPNSAEQLWSSGSTSVTNCTKDLVEPKPQRHFLPSKSFPLKSSDKLDFSGVFPVSPKQVKANQNITDDINLNPLSNASVGTTKDCEWSFPSFTGDNLIEFHVSKAQKCELPQASISTQTEPYDFVVLHKLESNALYVTTLKTLKPSLKLDESSVEVFNKLELLENEEIPLIPHFDKSTDTSDIPSDLNSPEKIKILKSCFPEIIDEDLKHLFEICHGDSSWLSDILLEWGYKYNVPEKVTEHKWPYQEISPIKSLSVLNCHQFNDSVSASDDIHDDDSNKKQLSDDQSVNIQYGHGASHSLDNTSSLFEKHTSSSDAEDIVSSCSSSDIKCLKLILDPALASGLQELFGPVSEILSGVLPEHLRTINLSYDFAKSLFVKWKESLLLQTGTTSDNESSGFDSNSHLSMENIPRSDDPVPKPLAEAASNGGKEPKSLSEIMDMEYALQLYREEKLKSEAAHNQRLSVRVGRAELYRMFPGVDTLALDDVFESNNCCLKSTLLALQEDVGKPAKIGPRNAVRRCLSDSRIFQDFITGNWADWVHEDDFFSKEAESKSLIVDSTPEAEQLRAEAVMHYQIRQECISKAQSAYCRGMKEVASFYAQKGDFHGTKFKAANRKASELIIQNRNKSLDSQVLDLHGLYIQEAIPILQKFLKSNREKLNTKFLNEQTVTVVTGRGAHSLHGAKLRPSVIKYLKTTGYRFDEINLGVFNICVSASPQI